MIKLLKIWKSKWWLITLLTITSSSAAYVYSYLQPNSYVASVQVVIDLKSPDPIAGVVFPGQLMPSYVATQVDIIKSRRVAGRVVDTLKLAENPIAKADFEKKARSGTPSSGSLRDNLSDFLLKTLEIKPSKESSVLSISFTGSDPKFSATVANAFAKAYIDTTLSMRSVPAKESAVWFDSQTQVLRETLDKSQKKLSGYQRSNGIISGDERFDTENARLQELSSQLSVLTAQTVDSEKRQSNAAEAQNKGSSGQVQEILSNSLIQSIKADMGRIESRLQERLSVLGSGHPDIVKLEQELAAIKSKLKTEEAGIVGSLDKGLKINQQRLIELKAAYERQRSKVLSIKQSRDELNMLQRETDAAQRAFDSVSGRLTQSNLESQVIQTNVAILNAAIAPNDASSPLPFRNSTFAAILGLLVGLGGALLLENLSRKIRILGDLEVRTKRPIIGVIPALPSNRQLRKLDLLIAPSGT
jgi:polysaccharide biosynthesis transport protein